MVGNIDLTCVYPPQLTDVSPARVSTAEASDPAFTVAARMINVGKNCDVNTIHAGITTPCAGGEASRLSL